MGLLKLVCFVLLPLAINNQQKIFACAEADTMSEANAIMSNEQSNFKQLLHTETTLIDALRDYIVKVEKNLAIIKRKTKEIGAINEIAMNDTDAYVNNPIKAFMILKRFKNDWNILHKIANRTLATDRFIEKIKAKVASLHFPAEDDFDDAIGNILRLSDIYQLQPQMLSTGQVNGIKFGSEMSWSDCLEIGRKSEKNGDYRNAKYWIETALDKLPSVLPAAAAAMTATITDNNADTTTFGSNSSTNGFIQPVDKKTATIENDETRSIEAEKARFEILQALLNTEFHMGNFESAANIADEMLTLKPNHKGILSAKQTIDEAIKEEKPQAGSKKHNKKGKKSVEELLIEETCRETTATTLTTASGREKMCFNQHGNLAHLLIGPVQMEIVNVDPYIAIYHNILTKEQAIDFIDFIDEIEIDSENDEIELQFTDLGRRRLTELNVRIQHLIGHSSRLFDEWKPQRYHFEDDIPYSEGSLITQRQTIKQQSIYANILMSLQSAKLGGSIAFPQLELNIQLPATSLLYWSNLNEYQEIDYRTKQYFCPVIAGTQTVAFTTIQHA